MTVTGSGTYRLMTFWVWPKQIHSCTIYLTPDSLGIKFCFGLYATAVTYIYIYTIV